MSKMGFFVRAMIVLALPNMASAAFKNWNPKDTAAIPKLFSQTGFYTNITEKNKIVVDNAYHFDVNAPLWSDSAKKERWVVVPKGKSIVFDEKNDVWKCPDSTVFVKLFSIDTIPGNAASRIMWETRVLFNVKEVNDSTVLPYRWEDYWYSTTYRWNADQKDAQLVTKKGLDDSIRVYPNGVGMPSKIKKWHFPSRAQCEACHRVGYIDTVHGRSILGFFTAQLNRPHPDNAAINQLQSFFDKGIMTGPHPTDWNGPLVPKFARIDDQTASVDKRARSYIAANCSGCHGRRGMETGATFGVNLNYDFHNMESQMEFRYRPTAYPFGLDTVLPLLYKPTDSIANPRHLANIELKAALTVPQYPSKSVLLLRQISRNTIDTGVSMFDPDPRQMPPLGTFEVDVPATTLMSQWISAMTPMLQDPELLAPVRRSIVHSLLKSPSIEGRMLRLPPELAANEQVNVTITGINGRTLKLNRVSRGTYAIPASLSPGVYIIGVNEQAFTRHLF